MAQRVLYTYQHVAQMTVVGGNVDSDSLPWAIPSTYDQIAGVTVFSSPMALMSTTQVEGTDFPFFTRDLTAREYSKKRAPITYTECVSSSLPIITVLSDDTPLFVSKVFDLPWNKEKARLREVSFLEWSRGFTQEIAPATTYTDNVCRLLSEIQRHMLENTVDNGVTWQLWTQSEVVKLINARISRFLLDTGMIAERETQSVGSGVTSVDLPSDTIYLKRLAWDSVGAISGLHRVDSYQMDRGSIGWESGSGTPYAYIEEPRDPLTIQLVNTPSANGTLDIIYVPNPEEIPVNVCSILPIPSAFVPYIKYGVMADMFGKEGEAHDPQRQQYCAKRYEEGIELARMHTRVRYKDGS